MPWDPKHEGELDRLLAPILASAPSSTPGTPRAKLVTYSVDLLSFMHVYLDGFAAIFGGKDAGPLVTGWVRENGGRSPPVFASLIAAGVCSALESFMTAHGAATVDAACLTRLRRASRLQEPDDVKAHAQVLGWLRPSAKDGGDKWIGRVGAVFQVTVPPAVGETLVALLAYRNAFAHDGAPPQLASGDEIRAWVLAVVYLANLVAP